MSARNPVDPFQATRGHRRKRPGHAAVPAAAAAIAAGYLVAAIWWPVALPAVAVAAVGLSCALVLQARASRALRRVLTALAAWLAAGLAGAMWLGGDPIRGLLWILLVLFLLPLPLIPWGYSATFRRGGKTS